MSDKQNDLRERLEKAISSAIEEWDMCAYDVIGVLECMKFDFLKSVADGENTTSEDAD